MNGARAGSFETIAVEQIPDAWVKYVFAKSAYSAPLSVSLRIFAESDGLGPNSAVLRSSSILGTT